MTLELVRDGVVYDLEDGSVARLIGDDGWGMAPLHRLSERGPLQHGETDLGFRLDPRVGMLAFILRAGSEEAMYTARETLLDLFAPSGAPLALRWTLPGRTRQIDVQMVGGLALGSQERGVWAQKAAVTLKASDPTFYDPAGAAVTFALGGGEDALEIPMEVPMVVGASTINGLTTVTNGGNWLSYPHLIRIVGPITDPVILNVVEGMAGGFHTMSQQAVVMKLDFTGTTIAAGDRYDIDLRYGRKTVVNAVGTNKIADLTSDSDLATWHLTPGDNSIRVTGTGATETTRVEINFFERYLGL